LADLIHHKHKVCLLFCWALIKGRDGLDSPVKCLRWNSDWRSQMPGLDAGEQLSVSSTSLAARSSVASGELRNG
jgi:hypothetical protein